MLINIFLLIQKLQHQEEHTPVCRPNQGQIQFQFLPTLSQPQKVTLSNKVLILKTQMLQLYL